MNKQKTGASIKVKNPWIVQVGLLIVSTAIFSGVAYAGDVQIINGQTHSVSLMKAEATSSSEGETIISGLLKRFHKLPMAGHIHSYSFTNNGELIAQNKHRIARLNSQRGGAMRIPFSVSIGDSYDKTGKIILEYHSPGHVEK